MSPRCIQCHSLLIPTAEPAPVTTPQTKVFKTHRFIAWLYGVLAAGLIATTLILLVKGESNALALLPGALVLLTLSAIHHFTGRACRQGKRGGRISSIALSLLLLLGFPAGTLVAIYLLSNTWRPWRKAA